MWTYVGGVDVHHRDLPGLVEPGLLLLVLQQLVSKQRCAKQEDLLPLHLSDN